MITLTDYKKSQFTEDLKGLKLEKPNSTIQKNSEDFGVDENTVYFGCKDWANLSNDISGVKNENLENFLLCLFSMVAIDLTIHTYFKKAYPSFREKTNSFKFGWSGFGAHYEIPSKLLSVPEKKGAVNYNTTAAAVESFVEFFIVESKNAISISGADIDVKDFIGKLLSDKQFQVGPDTGSLFAAIYEGLEKRINL